MMNDQGGDGKFVRKLLTGPIIHETLSSDFIRRVKAFKAILAEVEIIPLELAMDSFRRDHDPEKELRVWEHIAKVYAAAMAEYRHLSLAQKKEVLSFLLSLSMGDANTDRCKTLMPEMITWIAEEHLGRHPKKGRAGLNNEYSENVPSDLEFLGGNFNVLQVGLLRVANEYDSPALRLVKEVLLKTLEFKGANFTVQPFEDHTRVRGKLEGKWHELMRFPAKLHKGFAIEVARLWCGDLDLHWGLPLDGLLQLSYPNGDWYDVFVNAVPGIHSLIFKFTFCSREKTFDLDLDKLGFDEAGLRALKQAVDAPKGMVLLSGITGSGKSIVCCSSVMRRLRKGDSATTIERPRKFRLPGARQIHLEKYVDFHTVFPSALEDNPRVLMVQELRCFEEYESALMASRERLVVAATHLNDVLFCLQRLHGIAGSELYPGSDIKLVQRHRELLAENLSLVCSGRLVMKLCPHCRTEKPIPAATIKKHGIDPGEQGTVLTFDRGRGCDDCRGSGLLGRTGIYEVLPISSAMQRLLRSPVVDCALIRQVHDEGFVRLRETALRLALEGIISFQEAVSATPEPYYTNLFKN